MPLPIPLQTLTSPGYVQFGQNGYYASGFITIANGNVDVIVNQTNSRGTPAVGISGSVTSPNLTPGQYTFSKGEGTLITGLQIRPANGAFSSIAQTVQGILYEPTSAFIIPIAASTLNQNISSTMVKISSQFLGGPAATVVFSNIPGTFTALKLIASVRTDQAADETIFARLNGDAGADYSYQLVFAQGGAASATGAAAQTQMQVGIAPTDASSNWGLVDAEYPMYSLGLAQNYRSVFSSIGAASYAGVIGGIWSTAAIITSITLFPNVGNFASGSQFTLYGF